MEYVAKETVKPHRAEFHEIIELVRPIVKEDGITFTYILIGSAKRNLVIKHHNRGFDCDYKIKLSNDSGLKAKKIKFSFINAFDSVITDYGYSTCEDSTQSLTFKKVDTDNSKIEKGFDVIITKEYETGTHILRNDKKKHNDSDYHFVEIKDTKNHAENYKKIQGNDMWRDLRENYLEKREKEENKSEAIKKKGYQVLNETVNEILISYDIKID